MIVSLVFRACARELLEGTGRAETPGAERHPGRKQIGKYAFFYFLLLLLRYDVVDGLGLFIDRQQRELWGSARTLLQTFRIFFPRVVLPLSVEPILEGIHGRCSDYTVWKAVPRVSRFFQRNIPIAPGFLSGFYLIKMLNPIITSRFQKHIA